MIPSSTDCESRQESRQNSEMSAIKPLSATNPARIQVETAESTVVGFRLTAITLITAPKWRNSSR
jgi:hypothetical protein